MLSAMSAEAPSGRVTLVFTDIQDSTALWERLGGEFRADLDLHHEILRGAISAWRGYEVKTEGDAFMIAFARAADAVGFAIAAQESLASADWPHGRDLVRVRMGLHTGDPICVRDAAHGRMDYLGPVVNRAARISAAGHGGQILLSEATYRDAPSSFGEAGITDLGEHRLKGLERPEHLWQAVPQRLSRLTFPPLKTLAAVSTNLPYQPTAFIGREKELKDLSALIGQEAVRLVTLLGPGGTGKTRVALRLAGDLLGDFEGGCWFADLSETHDAPGISRAVLQAFGVPCIEDGRAERAVSDLLQYRKPLLLVLDNFEQVAGHATATVGLWRQDCPHVKFLVTSRTLLGLPGERVVEIGPLAAPEPAGAADRTLAEIAAYDGVSLFVERASEACPGFILDERNARDVAAVCAELEGMPLAIELAASRVRVLSPGQLLARLGKKFELLKSSKPGTARRQKTLTGAIEWSYDLLEDWEKQAFLQSCVFRGGFTLDAAEAVLSLPEGRLVVDAIQSLREKSFLRARDLRGEPRFQIYAVLRDFGEQRWKEGAGPREQTSLRERHARHYVAYAETWREKLRGPEGVEALDRIEAETENVFAIQDWANAQGLWDLSARAILALVDTLWARGPIGEIRPRVTRAFDHISDLGPRLGVWLRIRLAESSWTSNLERSRALADEAVQVARHAGLRRERFEALQSRALLGSALRELDVAFSAAREGERLCREDGNVQGLASILAVIGQLHWVQGEFAESLRYEEESKRLHHEMGNQRGLCFNHYDRGMIHLQWGDIARALECFDEAVRAAMACSDKRSAAHSLAMRGVVWWEQGEHEKALKSLREAELLARSVGARRGVAGITLSRAMVLRAEGRVQEALGCHAEVDAATTEMNDRALRVNNKIIEAVALCALGNCAAALDSALTAESEAQSLNDPMALATSAGHKGGVLLRLGRLDEAEDCLRRALDSLAKLSGEHLSWFFEFRMFLAQLAEARGQPAEAARIAVETHAVAKRYGLSETRARLVTRQSLAALAKFLPQ